MGWLRGAGGLLLAAVLGAAPAQAGEGRIEINQTRALAGGVTAGDTAGFPVSLTEPGSYVLTGDLTVANAAQSAILIASDDVTVDLAGHALVGPRTCTGEGSGVSCDITGAGGDGVELVAGSRVAVTVRNGVIRGFEYGVYATFGRGCILEGLDATRNSDVGIQGGHGCILLDDVSERNGSRGFFVGFESVVLRSVAVGNALDGFQIPTGAVVVGNTSRINGEDGFSAGSAVLAGNTASANEDDGMDVTAGSAVVGNACTLNAQQQLRMPVASPTGPGWAENVLKTDPGIGTSTTFSGGTSMGSNLCDNALCP